MKKPPVVVNHPGVFSGERRVSSAILAEVRSVHKGSPTGKTGRVS
jgi:hypothetical protein